jgi:chemotaxis methyl-accepting protein methylase
LTDKLVSDSDPRPEELAILARARELFGHPENPASKKRFLDAIKKRCQTLDIPPAKFLNLLEAQPDQQWPELWSWWGRGAEDGFFKYQAQLEALGRIILEWAPYAPRRQLKVLSVEAGAGYEAVSLVMLLLGLGLAAKGWEISVLGLDLCPSLVIQAKEANYPRDSLLPLPSDLVRRYFTPRAGGWHFKDQGRRHLRFFNLNIHRLAHIPEDLSDCDFILARGLSFDIPDQETVLLFDRLKPFMAQECLILTAPGEFWPKSDEFYLEERDGVTYYRRTQDKLSAGPRSRKKAGINARRRPRPQTGARGQSLRWAAEEKLAAGPEEARLIVTELIHEEMDQGFLNPESVRLMEKVLSALERPNLAEAAARVLGYLAPGPDNGQQSLSLKDLP